MLPKRKFLGEMLVLAGHLTEERLQHALSLQKQTGKRIGELLIEQGYVTEEQINQTLEDQLGIPFVDLNTTPVDAALSALLPMQVARRYCAVPLSLADGTLRVAMDDPLNLQAINEIRMMTGHHVQPLVARSTAIYATINRVYANREAEQALEDYQRENPALGSPALTADSFGQDVHASPIVRLVNALLEQAVSNRASDIHIEPMQNEVRVRMRVDGALQPMLSTTPAAHAAILARIKIMSGLDIAEKRRPQDGRMEVRVGTAEIDVRVSTMPTVYGEKAVLRLLDRSSFLLPKRMLGLTEQDLAQFDALLRNPHGILLVTGPTGCGKTTTLYTMLSELNTPQRNIITIEDPVEYIIGGLNQVQINPKAGLTFATGLRSILRQDPNVIMVGEIRDSETAQIAVRAAITGHLVLSTLHTNDAASAITRLSDMGLQPYMLSASLVGVIAQRLLRRICPSCAQPYQPEPAALHALGLPGDARYLRGHGCINCGGTGYFGRTAAYEIMVLDGSHRELIYTGAPLQQLVAHAIARGMTPLADACARLVREGITTAEEALSVAFHQAL